MQGLEQGEGPVIIRNYEIVKPIGKGKFAIVYNARKIDSGETVAFKRISVNMMDEKSREKCLKEVRLLQSLNHPNIIQYMDSFIEANDLIIIVEWAAAGDLKRQLRKMIEKKSHFEERIIWKYFAQICDAIQHMHMKRIMHRDLKPANIFLTLDGIVKVGDLGLSRELSENTIQAHSKVGTPLYMSPEVLRGDGYGFASDIWSLGCLLYELANLKSPFKSEGLNLYSLFQKISRGEYELLPETYTEELRQLAYSMITIQPEDRPSIDTVCSKANQMRTATANDKVKAKKKANEDSEDSNRNSIPLMSNDIQKNVPLSSLRNINFDEYADNYIQPSPQAGVTVQSRKDDGKVLGARTTSETKHDSSKDSRHIEGPKVRNGGAKNLKHDEVTTPERTKRKSGRVNETLPNDYLIGRDYTEEDKVEDHSQTRLALKLEPAAIDPALISASLNIHFKLEILQCPVKRPYRHLHFATNLNEVEGPRRPGKVTHNQFQEFIRTTYWLFSELGSDLKGASDEESPLVISKSVLIIAQVTLPYLQSRSLMLI